MHRSGSVRQIWDAFGLVHKIKADGDELRGSDQRWITNILGEDRYPSWNTQDGVYDIFDVEKEHDLTGNILPSNACIVAVNGLERDVSMPHLHEKYIWLRDNWV